MSSPSATGTLAAAHKRRKMRSTEFAVAKGISARRGPVERRVDIQEYR
jgi:hypothetical protein